MQLDDLKHAWAAHGALLERTLAIDERLLRDSFERKVRRSLAPFLLGRVLEVVAGVAALGVIAPVLAAHVGEPRYLVAGGALLLVTALVTVLCARLLVLALRLDFTAPVAELQRALARVRLAELHALLAALLGGTLVWLPALLVPFEALTGIDALARVNGPWLLANLAFGVVVAIVGLVLSRRWVGRTDLGPRARRVVDALSGRSLRRAAGHLDELARFVREEGGERPSENPGMRSGGGRD